MSDTAHEAELPQRPAKFRKGQVVVMTDKQLPFRILDVTHDDGEWFYAWSKKNYAHEPMLRALTPEEI